MKEAVVRALGVACAALILVSAGDAALACSCTQLGTIAERFASADAVFVGTAVSFELELRDTGKAWGDREVGVWTMDVTQVFKGPTETRLIVRTDITTSCSYEFELHEKYLVYASYYGLDGLLGTGQCSGGGRLVLFEKHLAELPPPIFDTARSGGALVASSLEQLLTILETSDDPRSRLGAWAAIAGLETPAERLMIAAERSLEVADDAEWILAVDALAGLDWTEIDPYGFIGSVLTRGNRRTTWEVLDCLGPRFESDPTLVQVLGRAVLARRDSALDDTWLRLPHGDTEVADAIVILLRRPDRSGLERGVSAILDLELSDPRFLPLLEANVGAVEEEELSFVAWALGYQGVAAVDTLIELLASDSEWARESAAYGLGRVGAEATKAIGPLTALLEDESWDVEFNAALALERIEPGLGWPVYEEWLNHGEYRSRAAEFLRSLQTDHAVVEMIRRLSDPDCHPDIVFGLREAGARAAPALPKLRELMVGDSRLGLYAAEAVQEIEAAMADE